MNLDWKEEGVTYPVLHLLVNSIFTFILCAKSLIRPAGIKLLRNNYENCSLKGHDLYSFIATLKKGEKGIFMKLFPCGAFNDKTQLGSGVFVIKYCPSSTDIFCGSNQACSHNQSFLTISIPTNNQYIEGSLRQAIAMAI